MSGIDVSIILNVHHEQDLLYPTLRSLLETVEHAHLYNIRSELVIVVDHADEKTLTLLRQYDYSGFDAVKLETTQVHSLGLARNCGVQAASGEYIITADADDLVSRNFIYEFHKNFQQTEKDKLILFPEYYHAFGNENYVCRFYPLAQVGIYRMAGEHPYVSRFMARREDILEILYRDCASHPIYAYEDYDINLRLVSAGFEFEIAADTIVFYRQRRGSIMAALQGDQKRIAYNSDFFSGEGFLRILEQKRSEAVIAQKHIDFKKHYMDSLYIQELVHRANLIDPEIHPYVLHDARFFTNIGIPETFGRAYAKICEILKGQSYTDVFFLPFLSKGGGEKYILNFIREVIKEEKRSCLILLGEELCLSKERCQVPEGVTVLDLYELLGETDREKIPEISVRIIENFANQARIFLKFCPFCVSVMKAYADFFLSYQLVCFYFCPPCYVLNNVLYEDGSEYNFLSEYRNHIDYVISDNHAALAQLEYRIPTYREASETLYTYTQPAERPVVQQEGERRLIWASRLDAQKRPDLLRKIALELHDQGIETPIYVYGSSVLDRFDPEYFRDCPNIVYKGDFRGLESLPFTSGDAFLYTSLFDGLPNVLLEAAEMKIPIITVDVGGISELIQENSGFLVQNSMDDNVLVARYLEQIKAFLAAPQFEIESKVQCLYEHFEQQHAQSTYARRVAAFYELLEKRLK
ncbi:glycosyltransferase [Acetobacter farinalis]|uniref:Glycosyltransferase n=1 Tax=Acetobacter farinalis TaxID=1260984 RepID=A0ABT3Q6J2_9PROT|nr:glycosyltransferase [Acetobacter farinalis]NHO29546.1 glycosyltransferase [Acetobacter farinalis]